VTNTVQIVAILVSATFLLVVVDLVRRRKLTEEYSFIWILCSLGLLGLSIWRDSLHAAARWLGIFYPPALLLLVLFFFVFVASLYFSVVISRQREQIERLVEEMAIVSAELRRRAPPAVPVSDAIANRRIPTGPDGGSG
jgi:cell division protein FtsW (lipid II flippase)